MDASEESRSVCGTCGYENTEMISILKQQVHGNEEIIICDVVMKCSSVQTNLDKELPEQMCKKCFDELATAFVVKKQNENMDFEFRTIVAQIDEAIGVSKDTEMPIEAEQEISHYEMATIELKQDAEKPMLHGDLKYFKFEEDTVEYNIVEPYMECNIVSNNAPSLKTPLKTKHCGASKSPQAIQPGTSTEIDGTCSAKSVGYAKDTTTENAIYKCSICPKTFTKEKNLLVHEKCHAIDDANMGGNSLIKFMLSYFKEKPFNCDFCDQSFNFKHTLRQHIRTHGDKKTFNCDVCDYCCVDEENFRQHMTIHNDKLSCDSCNFTSTSEYRLKRHMIKRHIWKSGKQRFKCDVCKRWYVGKAHLKNHMRIHTGEKPFKCEFCGYRSAWKSSLQVHVMTHTGEKPFRCHVCDNGYLRKSDLKIHFRNHTGDKPFKCDVCGYRCTQKSNLKQHLHTHYQS